MDSTAVMGKRIGAYVIDVVLGWIVLAVAFVLLAERTPKAVNVCWDEEAALLCGYVDGIEYAAEGGRGALVYLCAIGAWFVMGWIIQGLTGGTPGKLMVGLRVVDLETGQLAGLGKCLGRTTMWLADGFPYFVPLVGLITGVSTKGHRRVGDMVAKTLVVDKTAVGTRPYVPGLTVAPSAAFAPAAPHGTYSPLPPGTAPLAVAQDTGDGVDAPKWDAERGAYIQWDKQQQVWMTYDYAASQWRRLT